MTEKTDVGGNNLFMGLPPTVRAKVIAALSERDQIIASLQRQNARLIRDKDTHDVEIKQWDKKHDDLLEAFADLCNYVDLMESPSWSDIDYDKYKRRRARYVAGRQKYERGFIPPPLPWRPDRAVP